MPYHYCLVCGKEFYNCAKLKKFCSIICYNSIHSNRTDCSCKICNKIFTVKTSVFNKGGGKYCSKKCMIIHQKTLYGELTNNWKGGKSKISHLLRTSRKYKIWKLSVLKKDSFKCCNCGSNKGGDLDIHHIISVKRLLQKYNPSTMLEIENIKEFWDINNGITLCKKCHRKLHKEVKNGI